MNDESLKFAGMTVNERLAVAGLLLAFDEARARGDKQKLKEIAVQVDLQLDDDGMFWSDPIDDAG